MHLLANLTDRELLIRIRKLYDREAIGVLLGRYCHLMVAMCLPRLGKDATADVVFPELVRQISGRLEHTTGKMNEQVHQSVYAYFSKKMQPFIPPPYSQAVRRLENRVENAGNNPIERQALAGQLEKAITRLGAEELQLVQQFYVEHRLLKDLASERQTTPEKLRSQLKSIKKKLATQLI